MFYCILLGFCPQKYLRFIYDLFLIQSFKHFFLYFIFPLYFSHIVNVYFYIQIFFFIHIYFLYIHISFHLTCICAVLQEILCRVALLQFLPLLFSLLLFYPFFSFCSLKYTHKIFFQNSCFLLPFYCKRKHTHTLTLAILQKV